MAESDTNANAEPSTDPVAPSAPEAAASPSGLHRGPAGHGGGPQEVLAPKERRRRLRAARSAKSAQAKPGGPRSDEQRHEERVAQRRQKAAHRRAGRAKAKAKASHGETLTTTPPREHAPGVQKVRQGVVVSDRAAKTITVRIDTARRHRRYDKIVRTSSTVHAHDEQGDAHIGDTVVVREARPLSATKRWRLIEIVQRAK